MKILTDQERGIISITPMSGSEEISFQKIFDAVEEGSVLEYRGREGADPNSPASERMCLTFSHREGETLKIIGTSDEDDQIVRQFRDAVFFGAHLGGLFILERTEVDGKSSLNCIIARCRVCKKPVISRIESEWRYCNDCATKCEHRYKEGAIHGGGIDMGVGEFCQTCGRIKPEVEEIPEKPLYDHHIDVEERLGIGIFYRHLPGFTPSQVKGLMEGTMPKILVVEDDEQWSELIKSQLGNEVLVAQAFSTEEAKTVFQNHPDIALVLMDACVPGETPNTMSLVREIRETFKFEGPMIAISSVSSYRKMLVDAGCDEELEKPKAAQRALELVGTP